MCTGALPHDDATDVGTYQLSFVQFLDRSGDCGWPTFEMKRLDVAPPGSRLLAPLAPGCLF
jgi:hypothetical protein